MGATMTSHIMQLTIITHNNKTCYFTIKHMEESLRRLDILPLNPKPTALARVQIVT